MSNAKNIYDQIIDEGYILTHMVGQPLEDTWLDCKQKRNPNRGKMDDDDKNNFAKSLSGFGNTDGGVLIFGVDARKVNNIDVVQSIIPIKELLLFESELRDLESKIVQRALSGLEYKKIYTNQANDTGIIIIYIPEGNNPPYRSMRDKEFYIRAGGNFVSSDVSFIENLMSKKFKPDIEAQITIDILNKPINTHQNNFFQVSFRLTNKGNSIAEHVLVEIKLLNGSEAFYVIEQGAVIPYERWRDSITKEVFYQWVPQGVIHPNRTYQPPLFQLEYHCLPPPPLLIFELAIYAHNMPRKVYLVNMDATRVTLALIGGNGYQLTNQDYTIKQGE
jgi:hypothetical protein